MNTDSLGAKLIVGLVVLTFGAELAYGLAVSIACAAFNVLHDAALVTAIGVAALAAVAIPVLAVAWVIDLLAGTHHAERWVLAIANSGRILIGRRPVRALPEWLQEMQRPGTTIIDGEAVPAQRGQPKPPTSLATRQRQRLP